MNKTILNLLSFQIITVGIIMLVSIPFNSCKPDKPVCDTCGIVAYKPNIYLYPTEKSKISVKLNFPNGGKIITSIPIYGSGWVVDVDTSGIINNKYDFLFYESEQPDVWQTNEGWTIKRSDLEVFFTNNMLEYGFNEREIKDFVTYWIPRFTDSEYYEIYPQESKIIETVLKLDISKTPDCMLRLFYIIKGVKNDSNNNINIPIENTQFIRTGFCVTEWGVVLK